ncbi:ribonuclease E inhibitor RraB [Gayadomonas joobiniege]|uniref:ribonuclease E inhibitor RraB n=1 Tax=Gayadomonas joobiniege TaxID=1234606 RepID=UPI00036E65B9
MEFIDNPSAFSEEIVNALLADGSDPNAIYVIEHHFASHDFDKLEKAAVAAFKLEHEVTDAEEFETDDGQLILAFDVLIESELSLPAIEEQVKQMMQLAEQYQVEYDGWGTEFQPSDEID